MRTTNLTNAVRYFFWFSDTSFLRLILGTAALLFAFGILVPGHFLASARFAMMDVIPYEHVWGGLFVTYFCGVIWRFVDSKPRVHWALAINVLGSALWLTACFSMYQAHFMTASTAVEGGFGLLSLWVLYRTGLTPEVVTP